MLSRRERRTIIRAARHDRRLTRRELRDQYAPHVSLDTIYRLLKEHNIRKWIAKTRPKLEEKHAKARLAWALAHKDWTVEDFEGVIWSDECSVEKYATATNMWVFRTPAEKWERDCINVRLCRKGTALMVWGCFWGRYRGPLVPIREKSITSRVYRRLLHTFLLPVYLDVAGILRDPIFQHDNAPIHKGGIVMRWFDRDNIDLADHPPYSPDLNPIEHTWVLLKRQPYKDYPNIGNTPGGPEKIKDKLAEVLPLCWEKIPEKNFEALWKSMPARVQAVIDAKGWQTRY